MYNNNGGNYGNNGGFNNGPGSYGGYSGGGLPQQAQVTMPAHLFWKILCIAFVIGAIIGLLTAILLQNQMPI